MVDLPPYAAPDRSELKRTHLQVVAGDFGQLSGVPEPEGSGAPNEATLDLLYGESPFAGLDLEAHPEDLQGWNSYSNVFRDLIEAVRPRRIVEVGVWKGTASIHMAKVIRELGLRCEIVCVDTWLGSPEHLLAKHDSERYRSLRLHHGYPRLFYTFLANVVRNEVADYVVPLACTSESAAVIMRKLGMQADIVHVDAAHEYEPALRDFHSYWTLLSERGVLIGDDYIAKKSVTRAADAFAASVDRRLCGLFPKFVVARPPQIELATALR